MMELTQAQRQALWDNEKPVDGLHIVSARPGTGKTTTLTHYCEDVFEKWLEKYEPWQGIAMLSYTNVAREELQKKIKTSSNVSSLLSGANFIGTLDSFFNQHLFLPFGSAFMGGNNSRPELRGEPFNIWRPSLEVKRNTPSNASSPLYFDCYSFGIDEKPIRTDKNTMKKAHAGANAKPASEVSDGNRRKIANMKEYVWSLGYATQSDANYFALKILRSSSEITRYLIKRYPVWVIDEAQDMTEVQHGILDHLINNGLKHVAMIGDEYQSIYEWNTAKPQLFVNKKLDTLVWTSQSIDKTFRCSENICNLLTNMANDSSPLLPDPSGKNSEYSGLVRYVEYEDDTIRQYIDELARNLLGVIPHTSNDENLKSLAILAKSREDVVRLAALFNNQSLRSFAPIEWDYDHTKYFLKVIYYLQLGNTYKAFDAYEGLIQVTNNYSTKSDMRNDLIANNFGGVVKDYRKVFIDDLDLIKKAFQDHDEILISSCAILSSVENISLNRDVWQSIIDDCTNFQGRKSVQDRTISSLFSSGEDKEFFRHPDHPTIEITISTIHGVKGETYDGVFFFTKEQTASCTCNPASNRWRTNLAHNIVECENKRLAYVAASRAAQHLYIAAPSSSVSAWEALS